MAGRVWIFTFMHSSISKIIYKAPRIPVVCGVYRKKAIKPLVHLVQMHLVQMHLVLLVYFFIRKNPPENPFSQWVKLCVIIFLTRVLSYIGVF